MSVSLQTQRPLKTIENKKLAYLVGLEDYYKGEGYTTRLDGRNSILEIYPAGYVVPKTTEQIVIENFTH